MSAPLLQKLRNHIMYLTYTTAKNFVYYMYSWTQLYFT